MSAPLPTDSSISTELLALRRQVCELQQALAEAQHGRPPSHLSALGAAQLGTWEWEAHTNRVIWSPETEQIFGLPSGSFDGTYQGFFTFVHPDDRQRLGAALAKAVEDKSPYRIEHRIITPDGAVRWVACRGHAMFREHEPVTGMAGTIEDITVRKELELAQQDLRDTLEAQVRERTAGLEQAITDLKQEVERRQLAESALKASERRYQSLYEQNPFMYFTLTADGIVLSVNRFGADQLGYLKEDLIGQSIVKLFDSNDQQTVLTQLKDCAATPYTVFQWEVQKIRKDGVRLWVKERARAIHDQTGELLILVVCEDITGHKRTEHQLQETSRLLRTLVNESALPLVSLDRHGRVTSWNQAATRLFGWSEEEVLGHELPYVLPGEEAAADALWHAGILGELAGPIELTRRRKDGAILDLLLWPVFVYDEFKQVSVAIGIYVDQSDLKRAEEAKIKSEARLRSFLDTLDDLAFEFDEEGRYLNVWTRNEDKLLLPKQDLVGKRLTDIFGPETGAHYLETIRHVIATGEAATVDYTVSLGKEARDFSGILTLIPGSGADHATVGCLVRDVTERRRIEEQIRESEARWRALYEHAGVGIAQLSMDGQFLRVNPRLCEMLGYPSETMLQRKFHDLTHPDDLPMSLACVNQLVDGTQPSFSMEKQYRRRDGTWAWGALTVSLVRTAFGDPAYFIAVIQDIDDRKQAEQQLRESEQAIRSFQEATAAPGLTFYRRMQIILELGCRRFKLPIGMLTRVTGDQLEVIQAWPPSSGLSAGTLVPLSRSYCQTTLQTSGPTSFEHAGASEWSRHPGYAALGFECYLGTKLTGQHTNHGTICFMGPDPYPGKFSDADNAFLLLMARWIAGELDRQESEQALRTSELKFRTFVETTRDWVWEVNEHAVYTYASPRIRDILGYEPDEVIGKTPFDLMPPDEALRVADLFGPIAAAQQPFTLLENTNRHKNGRLVVLETSGTPIFDSAGTFRGYHGIDRDITDRKGTEEALRASERRLQRFVAEAPVGLCILDENWRTISANKALCELTGYEEHEIVGSSYALYTHPEDLAANVVLTDEFFRGIRSEYTCEKRYIRKSGEIIWVLVKATRVELSGHAGPLLLAAVQDITERKLAMEEREHLSRDLHDNILQALYAVGMQLEAGKLAMGKSPRRSKIHMTQAIDQLNSLMLDVRRFIALLTQRTTSELDFGQTLRQLIASMSGAGQSAPELDITNPVLSFITPKLGDQLLNIVREALSNSMRHAHASHRWVRLSLADNAICLIIGDNGVGFSTKRKRRAGHGLGNMAARAKQISATFVLETAPGKGTRVLVNVPLKKGNVYE